jgi:long-chain fatty acid transport protein
MKPLNYLLGQFSICLVTGAASAGGFDRGGVNIDLLFDERNYATEAAATYVSPDRKLRNVQRLDGSGSSSASVDVEDSFTVPRVGLKARFEDIDCLATYTEPYGLDANYGVNNAYSPTAVQFEVNTRDYGLTCSYRFNAGEFNLQKAFLRIIGGISYEEVTAFQSRQTLQRLGNRGLGTFNLSDEATSWRAGASYEIPDYKFRISVIYSARYVYDELAGTVDTTGFAVGPTGPSRGAFLGVFPATASTEVPQAVDLKFQSGIREGLPVLLFGSVRWQDWSKLQTIPINGVINPLTGAISTTTSFDPLFRDGWTVTAGIGRLFLEDERLFGSLWLNWDRGTSTTSGYFSDRWSVGALARYSTERVEFSIGGTIGLWQSGSSTFSEGDPLNRISYSFDEDLVTSMLGAIKVKF